MGYIRIYICEGYGFRDRVYKSESLGLGEGIIFQETDQLAEDFSLVWGNQELPLKRIKKKKQKNKKINQLC